MSDAPFKGTVFVNGIFVPRSPSTVANPAPNPRPDRKGGLLHIHLSFVFWKRGHPLPKDVIHDDYLMQGTLSSNLKRKKLHLR